MNSTPNAPVVSTPKAEQAPSLNANDSAAPHPRWKSDKSDRHPKTAAEWDWRTDPVGGSLDRSLRRLNVACDYDDPRAPDQMALVLRIDLARALADRTHKHAAWEVWRSQGWQPIQTAPKDGRFVLLFDPCDDDGQTVKLGHFVLPVYRTQGIGGWRINRSDWMAFDAPTHWQPIPTPPVGDGTDHSARRLSPETTTSREG